MSYFSYYMARYFRTGLVFLMKGEPSVPLPTKDNNQSFGKPIRQRLAGHLFRNVSGLLCQQFILWSRYKLHQISSKVHSRSQISSATEIKLSFYLKRLTPTTHHVELDCICQTQQTGWSFQISHEIHREHTCSIHCLLRCSHFPRTGGILQHFPRLPRQRAPINITAAKLAVAWYAKILGQAVPQT